jgi:hypothetical protein
MRFLTRLRSEDRPHPSERRCGHGPSRRRAAVRPRLEVLEGRQVLSTLTVTSSLDDGTLPGDGTLRGEIEAAQSGDTIVFAPSLDGRTIVLGLAQLEINKNLTIQGPGAGQLYIGGNGARVFQVDANTNVTISGLTIEGGNGEKLGTLWHGPTGGPPNADYYDGVGGGILNLGTMTINGCNVTKNSTGASLGNYANGLRYPGFDGGGIGNLGTMTINNCNVTSNYDGNNTTHAYGGGVYNEGTMTLSNCNVTGNYLFTQQAYSFGGGVYNDGTMTLSGCTVTGNSAPLAGTILSKGGGIFNDTRGQLTILSSTVLNNTASDGADIFSLGSIKISKDSQVGRVSHK